VIGIKAMQDSESSTITPLPTPLRVPLRIPGGWMVEHNQFYQAWPVLANNTVVENLNDSEDLLWLRQSIPTAKQGIWPEMNIDLGWYGSIFRLVLFQANQDHDHELEVFESLDLEAVQNKINDWLARY
jgi:hypothetical protein